MCSGDFKSIFLLISVPVISILVVLYLSCCTKKTVRRQKENTKLTKRLSRDTFDLRDKRKSDELSGKLRQ